MGFVLCALLASGSPARTQGASAAKEREADPAPAPASRRVSAACDGEGRTGWMLRQTLVGLTNALGGFYRAKAAWCRPLVRRPGLLWKLSQLEMGPFVFVTPSFLRGGGSLEIVPLSFLVLRLSVSGVYYWILPGFRASNYFSAGSYDRQWPSNGVVNDLSVDRGNGGGLNLSATLVLRAAVPLAKLERGPLELVVLDSFAAEYWYFPPHAYYYNQRADAVLARSDVGLFNTAALLLGFPLTARVDMRVGVTDALLVLPRPGRLAWHQVGGLVMFPIRLSHPRVAGLTAFTRITAYTHHHNRQLSFAWNFLVGADLALRL